MGNISQKLTYLNGTKTKIREGLNSLGADLDTQDTFRSYVDAIEGIYEDYPKITGEGESLSLDNTKQASMQIDYKGNTSQKTTIGKNLASLSNPSASQIKNLPITIENGIIKINGTADDSSNNSVSYQTFQTNSDSATLWLEIGGTYSIGTGTSNSALGIQQSDNGTTGWTTHKDINLASTQPKQYQITLDSSKYYRVRFYVATGNTFTNATLKFQLEYGSSKTDFEIATNGASPNPDYPQDVHVVSGDNTIDICGKNFFNPTETWSNWYGTNCTINNQQITWSGTSTTGISRKITDVNLPSGAYTISLQTISGSHTNGKNIWIDFMQGDTKVTSTNFQQDGSRQKTFNGKIDSIRIGFDGSDTFNNYTFVIQIEKGSTATTYEPYIGHSYLISLGDIELCKIGTYQDYIYKEDGSWYLHKEIGKIILNGSENWQQSGTYTNNTIYSVYSGVIPNYSYGQAISNLFIWNFNISASTVTEYMATGGDTLRIGVLKSRLSAYTINEFKTWLSNNNVTTYYVLATPTNTEITDTTLISQLEESKLSYISQTNISQVNNDLPFNLDVKALRGE